MRRGKPMRAHVSVARYLTGGPAEVNERSYNLAACDLARVLRRRVAYGVPVIHHAPASQARFYRADRATWSGRGVLREAARPMRVQRVDRRRLRPSPTPAR